MATSLYSLVILSWGYTPEPAKVKHYLRLLLFFFLYAGQKQAITFQVGPGLWQQNTDFLATAELGLYSDFEIEPNQKIHYHFYLPVFFSQADAPFVPGQNLIKEDNTSSNGMSFLREKRYTALFVPELYWQSLDLKVGVVNKAPAGVGYGLIVWGNPARNGPTPYLNSRFTAELANGGYFSSDTTKPVFHLMHYTFRPFTNSPRYLLNELSITPIVYVDFYDKQSPQAYGSGIELKTGAFRRPNWAFGSISAFNFSAREEVSGQVTMYQANTGLWFSFWVLEFAAGFIGQSENHPHGPYLSDLYAGRTLLELGSSSKMVTGNFLDLSTNPEYAFGFKGRAAIYYETSSSLSLHAWAFYKDDDDEVRIGFMKENIKIYRQLNRHHADDAFIEFMLKSKLIQKAIDLNWQTYLSWYGTAQARSKLWLSLLF